MEFDNAAELTDLTTIVKTIHPIVMVGTSKQAGAFTEEIVKEMAAHMADLLFSKFQIQRSYWKLKQVVLLNGLRDVR